MRCDGPVATVTLHRPEKRNALNGAVRRGLAEAVAVLVDDAAVRVVVLDGAGPVFSAGADLGDRESDGRPLAAAPGGWTQRRRGGDQWSRLLDAWEALPQVTVARVQGAAVGGGCLLAAMCDLRVVADDAFFSIPEVAIGIPLPWGGIPRLIREVGMARAREMVMTGRRIGGAEAAAWGLAHRCVPAAELDAAVEALVAELRAMPAGPLAMTKAAFAAAARVQPEMALAWPDPDVSAWASGDPETAAAAVAYRRRHLGR